MQKRLMSLCALGGAFLFLVGCASTTHGTKMSSNQVSQIVKGKTTKAEVIQTFGPPANVSLMGDGRRQMMYHFTESDQHMAWWSFLPFAPHHTEGTVHQQQLQVVLNKAEVVEDFEFNDGTSVQETNAGYGRASSSSTPR